MRQSKAPRNAVEEAKRGLLRIWGNEQYGLPSTFDLDEIKETRWKTYRALSEIASTRRVLDKLWHGDSAIIPQAIQQAEQEAESTAKARKRRRRTEDKLQLPQRALVLAREVLNERYPVVLEDDGANNPPSPASPSHESDARATPDSPVSTSSNSVPLSPEEPRFGGAEEQFDKDDSDEEDLVNISIPNSPGIGAHDSIEFDESFEITPILPTAKMSSVTRSRSRDTSVTRTTPLPTSFRSTSAALQDRRVLQPIAEHTVSRRKRRRQASPPPAARSLPLSIVYASDDPIDPRFAHQDLQASRLAILVEEDTQWLLAVASQDPVSIDVYLSHSGSANGLAEDHREELEGVIRDALANVSSVEMSGIFYHGFQSDVDKSTSLCFMLENLDRLDKEQSLNIRYDQALVRKKHNTRAQQIMDEAMVREREADDDPAAKPSNLQKVHVDPSVLRKARSIKTRRQELHDDAGKLRAKRMRLIKVIAELVTCDEEELAIEEEEGKLRVAWEELTASSKVWGRDLESLLADSPVEE